MEKKLRIQMLGGFAIFYGENAVVLDELDSPRAVRLLQMLLLSVPEGITKTELMSELYGLRGRAQEDRSDDLRDLIGSMKRGLTACGMPEDEYVEQSGDVCRFCCAMPFELDVQAFKAAVHQARATRDRAERIRLLVSASKLYRGELLPANSSEAWFYRRRAALKRLYLEAAGALEEEYRQNDDLKGRLRLYERAAAVYPYESWQARQIRCLLEMYHYDEALEVYHNTLKLYANGDTGAPPTEELRACFDQMELLDKTYREAAEKSGRREMDKKFLQSGKELNKAIFDGKTARGPYFCVFPSFVDYYRLSVRIKEQNQIPSVLLFITVSAEDGTAAGPDALPQEMECLKHVIDESLRTGDAYTRYGDCHFILMASGAKKEDAEGIFQRIRQAYAAHSAHGRLRYYAEDTGAPELTLPEQ